jgi:pyruvate dehydrogenase E1 component beta subunit
MIAADIVEHRFTALRAPIIQVTAADTTIPYSEPLEASVLPDEAQIITAVRKVLR